MAAIAELKWNTHSVGGGERALVIFPNGYSASVLRGGWGYTDGGTYEIAVMQGDEIDYSTPLGNDVLGYLSESEANTALAQIEALPAISKRAKKATR